MNINAKLSLPRFEGHSFLFVPKKLVKLQADILCKKIVERGGSVTSKYCSSTTHILVPRGVTYEEGLKSIAIQREMLHDDVKVLGIDWLPECIRTNTIVPTASFEITAAQENDQPLSPPPSKRSRNVPRCKF